VDGKSYTGKDRRPEGDPEKYRQSPTRVLSQVAQTKPDKKSKKEEYTLHGGSFI
jgi:hypothetical protein